MYFKCKNTLDFIVSFGMLILFFPSLLIFSTITLLVLCENPFFLQKRIGKSDNEFLIVKFKTLKSSSLVIPPFCSFMRKTGIDELPQLINVLKGEMSIVGPRPLLPKYLKLYSEEQRKRHLVKPGITGLAQVSGGNMQDWKRRLEIDVDYVNNVNLYLDLVILFKTISFVLFNKHKTPSESESFKGND